MSPSSSSEARFRFGARRAMTSCTVVLVTLALGCGGSTRKASSPHGKTTTTAAAVGPRIERLIVADHGTIAMVSRGGCLATVRTSESQVGSDDELRVRCPKPERINAWFDRTDQVTAGFAFEPIKADADDDDKEEESEAALPAAKVLTAGGKTLKVTRPADIQRLAGEVQALAAELGSSEQPSPGPASPAGWQMLHVNGPAHVLFAGTPARGVLEARVSTTGQYYCEFITRVGGENPMRATKSGWIAPATASKAIDEVLGPFNAVGPNEASKTSYAAGTKAGAESRSNVTSTGEVFARFAQVQEALGDACLPELEAPTGDQIGL